MKKRILQGLCVSLIIITLSMFAAGCGDNLARLQYEAAGLPYRPNATKHITVVLQGQDGEADTVLDLSTRADFLHEALVEAYENGKLSRYDYTKGNNYDAYVTAVGHLASSTLPSGLGGSYIALYHEIEKLGVWDPSIGENGAYQTITIGDHSYYYANDGFSLTPLGEGLSYYIALAKWGSEA